MLSLAELVPYAKQPVIVRATDTIADSMSWTPSENTVKSSSVNNSTKRAATLDRRSNPEPIGLDLRHD